MEAEGAGGKWQRGVGDGRAPHAHPARGRRETVVTVANANSRRPPAARSADARPLHDSPGPAQIAPSVGLGARRPGSPRGLLIRRPPSPPSSRQPPDANRLPVLRQWRRGSRQTPRAGSRKPRPWLPGSAHARAGDGGAGPRSRARGGGKARAVPGWPRRAGLSRGPGRRPALLFFQSARAPAPVGRQAQTHTRSENFTVV